MTRTFVRLAFIISSIVAGLADAQESASVTNLTLATAVDIALQKNPRLQSLRAKWEAMLERPDQAKALPNPMLSYSGMDMVDGGRWPDTNEKRVMIQQAFPWLGKRTLRANVATKDAERMQHELNAMTREMIMRVKESYFELFGIQRMIAITTEEEATLLHMTKIVESRFAAGTADQTDAIKAQSEATLLKQKLFELRMQENTLRSTLNTLMNRTANTPLGKLVNPPSLDLPIEEVSRLVEYAIQHRPEMLAAQTQIERYGLEKRLMEKEFLPDYKLGVEYRDIQSENSMLMFTISVELPIWQSKYKAGIREAERMQASSMAEREAIEHQIALEIQDAHFKWITTQRTIALYNTELLPQAKARFAASEAGYRTGKVDFLDLLESERFLLNAKTVTAQAEATLGMQAARLEWAIGRTILTLAPDQKK